MLITVLLLLYIAVKKYLPFSISFTSLWRTYSALFFAQLFKFIHIGRFLSIYGLFKVMSKQLEFNIYLALF